MMEKKTIYLFWYLHFSLFLIFTVMMSDAIGCRKEAGNLNISISWPSAISPPQQQTLLSGVIRIGSMPFFSLRLHSKVQPHPEGLPSSHLLQAPRNLSSLPLLRLASSSTPALTSVDPLLVSNYVQKIPPGTEAGTKSVSPPLLAHSPCPPHTNSLYLFIGDLAGGQVSLKAKVLLLKRKFEIHCQGRFLSWAELRSPLWIRAGDTEWPFC